MTHTLTPMHSRSLALLLCPPWQVHCAAGACSARLGATGPQTSLRIYKSCG